MTQSQDYYLAYWEDGQLSMEPYCRCGTQLSDDFFCSTCDRECDCTLVVCKDSESQAVVQKLIHGNPSFRNFQMTIVED